LIDGEPPEDDAPPPAGDAADPLLAAAVTPAPAAGDAAHPLEQRARLAEDRLAEVLAAYRKLKTDNEEFRERQSRNLERRFEQRRERLLLKFIDVLDNLDRALEAAQTSYAGQPLLEGMILVRTQLLQTLQDEGLDRIPVLGLVFDPAVSEAVATEPVKEPEQDHLVIKELLRGYRLNGRIARPSRVVIGMFQGARPEPEPAPAPVDEAMPSAAPVVEAAPATDVPATDVPAEDVAATVPPPLPPPAPSAPAPAAARERAAEGAGERSRPRPPPGRQIGRAHV